MVTPFDSGSDDDAFPPLPPPEPRAVLAHLLQALAAAFGPAAEGAVDRTLTQLALRRTQFVLEPYPLRALVVGPTGAGKIRLLRVLADAMRLPAAVIPVTDLSETGWRGPQVGEVCRGLFRDLFVRDGDLPRRIVVPGGVITRPCLLLLDEIDKLALVTHDGTRFDGTAAAASRQAAVTAPGAGPREHAARAA